MTTNDPELRRAELVLVWLSVAGSLLLGTLAALGVWGLWVAMHHYTHQVIALGLWTLVVSAGVAVLVGLIRGFRLRRREAETLETGDHMEKVERLRRLGIAGPSAIPPEDGETRSTT